MEFLSGTRLRDAISRILRKDHVNCAVAFWGNGAERQLSQSAKQIKIICNLKTGGTNPWEIEKLIGLNAITIKQNDALHAKVYLTEKNCLVTSTNVSANGLGFEGREQYGWTEAGILTSEPRIVKQAQSWFADIWKQSRTIEPGDIKFAKLTWMRRQNAKTTIHLFLNYEVNYDTMPLICLYDEGSDWETNPLLVKKQPKSVRNLIEDRVDESIEVYGLADREVLTAGRWILRFQTKGTGPYRRTKPTWLQIGSIQENAYRFKDEKQFLPAALPADPQGEAPFDISQREFRKAFFDVISQTSFNDLVSGQPEDAGWFTQSRLALIRQFWGELQERLEMNNVAKTKI